MFCTNCGKEIRETEKFCPECGNPVNIENVQYSAPQSFEAYSQPAAEPADIGPWKAFAILGFILGLFSLILFWSGPLAFCLTLNALPFSIMGRKSIHKRGMALAGIILSSIALGLSFIFFIASLPELKYLLK